MIALGPVNMMERSDPGIPIDQRRRPGVLPPPPGTTPVNGSSNNIPVLRCQWSAPIRSFDDLMRIYRPRSRMIDVILLVCFITGIALVVPAFLSWNDTTLGLSMCGGFGLFFLLIASLAALSSHREMTDRKREQNTRVYWKESDMTKKREHFKGLLELIGERMVLEQVPGTYGKSDPMEYRYRFDNGNYISVKYSEVGSDWSNLGWVRIGWHYDHFDHASRLQRKVDEYLAGTGAVCIKNELKSSFLNAIYDLNKA